MELIEPKTLTMDDILACNLAEDPTAEWDDETPYSLPTSGASTTYVKISTKSDMVTPIMPVKKYRLIADSAAGNYPPDYPKEWLDDGATNRFAMFDGVLFNIASADGSETSDIGKIVFRVNVSKQNAVGLFSISGTKVTFKQYSSTGTLLTTTVYSLVDTSKIFSWSTFFYDDRVYKKNLLHNFDLYHVSSLEITIEDERVGYYPELGLCLPGRRRFIGGAKDGVETTVVDLGDTFTKLLEVDVYVEDNKFDYVQDLLANLYGTPIILNSNNEGIDFDSFLIVGKYESFRETYNGVNDANLTISMTGLPENKR